jgi:hypothetical protein
VHGGSAGGRRLRQAGLDGRWVLGLGEVVALTELAADGPQELFLRRAFDYNRIDLQGQLVA